MRIIHSIKHDQSKAVLLLKEAAEQMSGDPADITIHYEICLSVPSIGSQPILAIGPDLENIERRFNEIADDIFPS